MPNWTPIVAWSLDAHDFAAYVDRRVWPRWQPQFVVVHNTAVPSLADRPNGLTLDHIRGLERYYRDELGWSAGPHLFIDDRQVWLFTPIDQPGVHSPSWNGVALGVELLGDYDRESFTTGRGAQVRANAIIALEAIHRRLNLDPQTIRLHREDPRTTHLCPGKNLRKLSLIQAVLDA